MDSTNLCNALRMEFEGVFENKIPLDAFPTKIQDMILALTRQENYSIEYMMASVWWQYQPPLVMLSIFVFVGDGLATLPFI